MVLLRFAAVCVCAVRELMGFVLMVTVCACESRHVAVSFSRIEQRGPVVCHRHHVSCVKSPPRSPLSVSSPLSYDQWCRVSNRILVYLYEIQII